MNDWPKRTIAVVGASCRAMAASLIRAGYQVAAGDLFADYDTRQLADSHSLATYPWSALTWLRQANVDAWCYTGGFENYPRLIQRLANEKNLLGISPASLRQVRDPFWLADLAQRYQFAFPESIAANPMATASQRNEAWLIKPYRSAGGLRVKEVDSASICSRQFYLQRKMSGTPMSAAVLSTKNNAQIIGLCRLYVGQKLGAPGPFVFAGGERVFQLPPASLQAIVKAIHQQANLIGLWGIDFMLADQPIVLEVNPRWTATMALHDRGRQPSLMDLHVRACEGEDPGELVPSAAQGAAFRILYARQAVTFSEEIFQQVAAKFDLSREAAIDRTEFGDIPLPGTAIEAGHPVCTLYAEGENEQDTHEKLQVKIAWVESLLYSEA